MHRHNYLKNINVKVTSTDGLGLIGSGDGIATLCAVNLIKKWLRYTILIQSHIKK